MLCSATVQPVSPHGSYQLLRRTGEGCRRVSWRAGRGSEEGGETSGGCDHEFAESAREEGGETARRACAPRTRSVFDRWRAGVVACIGGGRGVGRDICLPRAVYDR